MAESFGYVNVLGWLNHNHSSQANCTAFFGMFDMYCVKHEYLITPLGQIVFCVKDSLWQSKHILL